MCHTWGLSQSPAELHGVQVQGDHGGPLQVTQRTTFFYVFKTISLALKCNVTMFQDDFHLKKHEKTPFCVTFSGPP